jgi:hypothetical protein
MNRAIESLEYLQKLQELHEPAKRGPGRPKGSLGKKRREGVV